MIKEMFLTLLMSAVPIVELRGGIPYGFAQGLSWWQVYPAAVVGNLLPVPFLILGVRQVFAWLRKHSPRLKGLVSRLEAKADKNAAVVQKYEMLGLCILVAIPLPGTGAWTGALVAAMLRMRLKNALPSIALGVLIAGALVTLASMGILAVFG